MRVLTADVLLSKNVLSERLKVVELMLRACDLGSKGWAECPGCPGLKLSVQYILSDDESAIKEAFPLTKMLESRETTSLRAFFPRSCLPFIGPR